MQKPQKAIFLLVFGIISALSRPVGAYQPQEAEIRSSGAAPGQPVAPGGLQPSPGQTQMAQSAGGDYLDEAAAAVMDDEPAEVHREKTRGMAFIRPRYQQRGLARKQGQEDPNTALVKYVRKHRRIFELQEPAGELEQRERHTDELGLTHLRYQQRHRGIPIWGRQLAAHFNPAGNLQSVNSLLEPTPAELETQPVLTAAAAIFIAQADARGRGAEQILSPAAQAELKLEPSARLYYWRKERKERLGLVWMVELHPNLRDRLRYFIGAGDGAVRHSYNATANDGAALAQANNLAGQSISLNTYRIGASYYLIDGSMPMFVTQTSSQLLSNPRGAIVTLNGNNRDLTSSTSLYNFSSAGNLWTDAAAVSAMDHMHRTYDFYYHLSNYSRNSFDNHGSTMRAVLHITEGGRRMDNAYWNGAFVVLGDGDTIFKPLVGALDVIAHEFTHAIVQYSANLEYQGQSGALNETFADIGGVSVDDRNFTLGEDIIKSSAYFPTGALRDMGNPHNGGSGPQSSCWQPATMSEYQDLPLSDANGGVHVNSGISNFAAYKIMNSLGRDQGGQVLFRTLLHYLTSQANFTDFRLAGEQSAADIFGSGSAELAAVKQAFDEVGIAAGTGTAPPADNPVVEGKQYLVGANSAGLLVISNGFDNIAGLAQLNALGANLSVNVGSGRPIAVDRYGQQIYLVDRLNNLQRIKPDGSGRTALSGNGNWWSVAVSPSGRWLALTRKQTENLIWIYDTQNLSLAPRQLTLRHPTTDQNSGYSDIVQYADSMVFLDEQRLAYDCYNLVQSPSAGTIEFWDVNLIDVPSGRILPVLPPQPNGVNLGNPTVAATNSSILCVELFSANHDVVTGINLVTGARGTIVDNGDNVSSPHFAPDDSGIVFTRDNAAGTSDVYNISLAADKINPAGVAGRIIGNLQMPVWFVVGSSGTEPGPAPEPDPGPDPGTQTQPIQPRVCAIRAGLTPGSDALTFIGGISTTASALGGGDCTVRIRSASETIYEETIPGGQFVVVGGNYRYRWSLPGAGARAIRLLYLSPGTGRMILLLPRVDLGGLSSPVTIELAKGSYAGASVVGENVINGPLPIPIRLLQGHADALRLDRAQATPAFLMAQGGMARLDSALDLAQTDVTIRWGSQAYVIPAGGFRRLGSVYFYVDPRARNGAVYLALFNFTAGTFQIILKDSANQHSGTVSVGVQFGAFDQSGSIRIL